MWAVGWDMFAKVVLLVTKVLRIKCPKNIWGSSVFCFSCSFDRDWIPRANPLCNPGMCNCKMLTTRRTQWTCWRKIVLCRCTWVCNIMRSWGKTILRTQASVCNNCVTDRMKELCSQKVPPSCGKWLLLASFCTLSKCIWEKTLNEIWSQRCGKGTLKKPHLEAPSNDCCGGLSSPLNLRCRSSMRCWRVGSMSWSLCQFRLRFPTQRLRERLARICTSQWWSCSAHRSHWSQYSQCSSCSVRRLSRCPWYLPRTTAPFSDY